MPQNATTDSYVLTVGYLAHMLTALDTKLKLEWEPDERHELESKRNTPAHPVPSSWTASNAAT